MRKICIILTMYMVGLPSLLQTQDYADRLIRNAHIITVDPDETIAEAVAIKDSLIMQVGTNQEISALIGAETDVRNFKGFTITPGMIDAHSHLMFYGVAMQEYVDLR